MLFYRDGYVYDTADSSKEKVSTEQLVKALSLGVVIQGVKLRDSNRLETYNFVSINILRLQALTDCYTVGERTGTFVKFRNFGLQVASAVLQNSVHTLILEGSGHFVIDSFSTALFRVIHINGDDTVILDLTLLDESTIRELARSIYLPNGGFNAGTMLSMLENKRIRVRPELDFKFFVYFWLYNLKCSHFATPCSEVDYLILVSLLKPYTNTVEDYLRSSNELLFDDGRYLGASFDVAIKLLNSRRYVDILNMRGIGGKPALSDHITFLFYLCCLFPDSGYFSGLVDELDRKRTIAINTVKASME